MKQIAPLLLGSLVWTACSMAVPAAPGGGPPGPVVEPGREFGLRPGEVATVGSLRVGLEGVVSDSRCPKGERCITAGDARVRIWLQQGAGPRVSRELWLVAPNPAGAGPDVQLLRLEPYPVTGRTIAPADYVATLVLRTGSTAPSPSTSATPSR